MHVSSSEKVRRCDEPLETWDGLLEFGASCDIPRARLTARIIELAQIVLQTLQDLAPVAARLYGLTETLAQEARRYLSTFRA